MTHSAIAAFWDAVQHDAGLRSRLMSIDLDAKTDDALADVIRVAADAGFVFTADEYRDAVDQHMVRTFAPPHGHELGPDALDGIAAGVGDAGKVSLSLPRGALGYGFGVRTDRGD